MNTQERETVDVRHTGLDLLPHQWDHEVWATAQPIALTHYWSGEFANPNRHAEARLLWTPKALLARFESNQFEPLIVNSAPVVDQKTLGLWDRDVCEIFIAPDAKTPNCYFEFEAAPTGEYVDLAVCLDGELRDVEWDFQSGMTVAALIDEKKKTLTGIRIPWSAVISKPATGDIWLGNLCRCVGIGEDRGYLAWQPTLTEKANFHVPEKFGQLRFC